MVAERLLDIAMLVESHTCGIADLPRLLPMKLPGAVEYLARNGGLKLVGAMTSMAVAVALYTRFGIGGTLARDEAVYAYAGQQLAYGVPPYASIFDAKTPLASMIAGVAAAVAHLAGGNDIYLIRAAFFVCACLAVLAVYLLAAQLWRSVLAASSPRSCSPRSPASPRMLCPGRTPKRPASCLPSCRCGLSSVAGGSGRRSRARSRSWRGSRS